MNKRKVKILLVIVAIVALTISLCAIGYANLVNDGMFNMNTPTRITANSTVIGILESKEDYEAFIFDVEKDGALSVRLDHDDVLDYAKCGYKVTLYKIVEGEQREYKEITYFESFWSDVTASWGETGVNAGTYMVVVSPGADALFGEFTLVTTFTATSNFEKELNDSKETADTLKVGRTIYASSSQRTEGYDHDWFRLELAEDSCVNISFNHEDLSLPQVVWNVKILSENDDVICDFASKLADAAIETGTLGLKAGVYYVKVENSAPIPTTYNLQLKAVKAVNHEFELNDTPETAIELPHNVAMGGSLADRLLSLDKDYYKLSVPEEGSLDIIFSHEALEGDKKGWNIRVLMEDDGEYKEIVKKISAWNIGECTIKNLGLGAGEYYIVVDGDSLSYNSASYNLKWVLTPRSDFETEPNGSKELAKEIEAKTFYYGAILSSDVDFDEDYYKFEITKECNVSVDLGHEKINDSSLTWTASIIDENGDVIASVESSLNEGLVNTGIVTLKPGTYYIKVETGMYGSEVPYRIRLVR